MPALPIVVPRSRTVTVGAGRALQQRFAVDLQTQSLSDVHAMLRIFSEQLLAEQARAGNPAQVVSVDGGTSRPVEEANKKVVALFGTVLAAAAMHEVEAALREAIEAATRSRSGRLADVTSAWQWLFIPKGGAPRVVGAGSPLPAFQSGDQLVLRPSGVAYATRVNSLVAQSGRLTPKARLVKGKLREPAKRLQNTGFLFHAAEALRRRAAFKAFHVRVVFSKAHPVAGEVMTRRQGTGMIVISARQFGTLRTRPTTG